VKKLFHRRAATIKTEIALFAFSALFSIVRLNFLQRCKENKKSGTQEIRKILFLPL
jgi:hypothetical protein